MIEFQPHADGRPGPGTDQAPRPGADLAVLAAAALLLAIVLYAFETFGYFVLPGLVPVALLAGAIGTLILSDGRRVGAIPIPPLLVAFCAWMLLSRAWSENPWATDFALRRDVPLVAATVAIVGVIRLDLLTKMLVWSVRIAVVVTLAAVVVLPETRMNVDPAGVDPIVSGWHGLFLHKNVLGPYLVFGVVTVLCFDRRPITKWMTLAGLAVLLIGSESVTGIAGAIVAVSVWVWLHVVRSLGIRARSTLVTLTAGVVLVAGLASLASLSSLTDLSGRDTTFTGRTEIWSATWDAWSERPLFGFGLNGVLFDEPLTSRTAAMWREIGFDAPHAHNGILDVGVQLGIVGVILFVAVLVSTLIDGVRLMPVDEDLAAWAIAIICAQIVMSIAEDVFLGSGWLVTLVIVTVVLSRRRRSTESGRADERVGAGRPR